MVEITVLDNVTRIGEHAFEHCSDLKTLKFNGKVNTITGTLERYAFRYCENLVQMDISGASSAPSYCFQGCKKLSKISLNPDLTHIGSYCFAECENLTDILLPDSLSTIGGSTFLILTYHILAKYFVLM